MHIQVPLSKSKLAVSIGGSVIFIILGYFLITDDYELYNTSFTKAVGIAAIIFFGITLLYNLYRLFNKKPALIIDDNGITDNSGRESAGLIEWHDIKHIDVKTIISTRYLIIHVTNPYKYIKRVPAQKAWLMKRNMGLFGSPISISARALRYNFDELYRLLQLNLEKHNGHRIAED